MSLLRGGDSAGFLYCFSPAEFQSSQQASAVADGEPLSPTGLGDQPGSVPQLPLKVLKSPPANL